MSRRDVTIEPQAQSPGTSWKPAPPASYTNTAPTITLSTGISNSGGDIDSLFHPTTQKVVRTSNGTLFVVFLYSDIGGNHDPSSWRLVRSNDNGSTWSTVWDSATQSDPQWGISPALELDENEDLYVVANYYPRQAGHTSSTKLYRFLAGSNWTAAGVTPTTISSLSSGKWSVFLDQGRGWIWIAYWAFSDNSTNLIAVDYTGALKYSKNMFKPFTAKWTPSADGVTDKHGEPAYPAVWVGTDGTVYLGWTTMACEGGDFTNAALSYYDVRMVYSADSGATWQGPQTGVSGAPSSRTLPVAGDDSGTQAETAYPINKLSDQTSEFIPSSATNYGFSAPGDTSKRYNMSRLMHMAQNNGAVHFYKESQTSDVRALVHHSYARFRMATHDIADSERRSTEFKYDTTTNGDRLGTVGGQGGGNFIQDTSQASRLYFVQATSRDLDEKFRILRSDDAGLSWWLYGTSAAVPGGGSNGLLLVQGYRWVCSDGKFVVLLQLADSPYTIYTAIVTPS